MVDLLRGHLENLDLLFKPFLKFDRIILAVSGGSDSLALLYLAKDWTKRQLLNLPTFEVATIDHGFRTGSYEEACRVRTQAETLGFRHHLLKWRGQKPLASLQLLAREERYALLEQVALGRKHEHVAIATAHTSDDQAETVLMRLARGSGPDGLKGISDSRPLYASSQITLLRPFLSVSRSDLRDWLLAHNITWDEDPSNCDERFERVRLRKAAATFHSVGLDPHRLALTAKRQARAVQALEIATDTLQNQIFHLHGAAYGSLDVTGFRNAPEELRVRLLARLLNIFRGETPPPQLEQVERLVFDLQKNPSFRGTLGGCEIHAKKNNILIYREVGRATLPSVPLLPGVPVVWDRRFRVLLAASPPDIDLPKSEAPFMLRPFDPMFSPALREKITEKKIPVRAAATLPSVWWGEKLIKICGMGSEDGIWNGSFPLTVPAIHAEFLKRLNEV